MALNWSGGVWDEIRDPAGFVIYLHLSFSWQSHSQPHFAPCWQPSGWFWEHPAILHHRLGPAITHEHVVLSSTISIGLENKPRWLERQAIWRKEKKHGPTSRKKLRWECSALLSVSLWLYRNWWLHEKWGCGCGICTCCLMRNKMMIRWAGREANANVMSWKTA